MVLQTLKQPRTPRFQGALPTTFRIGFSGAPGVGKSSFIEVFGSYLLSKNYKIAVLAVDPSSTRTGGSILGDKTRMTELSKADNAFVRPTPSSCALGGVARNTNEAILLCEAAGYDVVFVETVGVGQSEILVAEMVDMFCLLVAPGAGDELQGLKKGIVEMCDLIIVNKADGVLMNPARIAQMEYTSALKFMHGHTPNWQPLVIPASSHEKRGLVEVWDTMMKFYETVAAAGVLHARRGEQQRDWMWRQVTGAVMDRLKASPEVKRRVKELEMRVVREEITSGQAAEVIVDGFFKGLGK